MRPATPLLALVLALLLGLPGRGALDAQVFAEEDQVLRALLYEIVQQDREIAHAFPGPAAFDPRPLPARWGEGPDPGLLPPYHTEPADEAERDPQRVEAITRGIAIPSTYRPSRRPKDRASCVGKCLVLLVQASEPVVRGDTAKVYVHTVRQTRPEYQYMAEAWILYTLVRTGGEWKVADRRVLGLA